MTMAYILAFVNPVDAVSCRHGTRLPCSLPPRWHPLWERSAWHCLPPSSHWHRHGLNAYFFAYTVCLGRGISGSGPMAVFAEGIVFIIMSFANVREAIFDAIPMTLNSAVSVGIGLFIAFIGLQNAKIIVTRIPRCRPTRTSRAHLPQHRITALLAIIGGS